MATALYLWSTINRKPEREMAEKSQEAPDLDPKPGATKPKGRRPGKSVNPQQKKIPQRGMGVAQLERLRLQERWKKMNETGTESLLQDEMYPFPFSFPDQPQNIPAPPVSRPTPIRYPVSFNGANIRAPEAASTAAYGGVPMLSEHISANQLRAAALGARFDNRNLVPAAESTRELSSIQKTHCFSNNCDVCSKKRFYSDDIGFQVNGCGLAEYNKDPYYFKDRKYFANRRIVDGDQIVDFGEKRERRASACFGAHVHAGGSGGRQRSTTALNYETNARAFQKKGKFAVEYQPTEYDFFSSTGNSTTVNSAASSGGQEAGGGAEASSSASSFLDLTLKLSSY